MPEASKIGRQSSSSDDSPSESERTVQLPVIPAKVFILKNRFEDISTLEDDEHYINDWEEHFGSYWRINLKNTDNHLAVYIAEKSEKMCIEGELRIDLIGLNADTTEKKLTVTLPVIRELPFKTFGCAQMLEWDKLEEYTVEDFLEVQVEVRISWMSEMESSYPSKFDSSKSKVSDCILVAQDQKFHVSRHFLATHSPYFEALLLGPFKEANLTEVQLPGLDPYDVENFLRVIYGYEAINDQIVEGLLLIADKNDTPIIKDKCEDFLVKDSDKSMKKMFDMFLKYNCDMDKIINKIKTFDEYKEVIGKDIDSFDHAIAKKLLKKSVELFSE